MTPLRRLKRWWRSKGFGIHSPFAFYFVTRVLRERLPYYAYADIDRMCAHSAVRSRELKLLFRVACYFNPSDVMLAASVPSELADTLLLADSRVNISSVPAEFQCYYGGIPNQEFWKLTAPVIRDGGVIVMFHSEPWMLSLTERMNYGMTFTDGSTLIIVVRHDLPRQDFEIAFLP